MLETYADALPQPKQDSFKKATSGMMHSKFEAFNKMYTGHLKGQLLSAKADNLLNDLELSLTGVFNFLRNMRNDTGHPTGKIVDRDQAYAHLIIFRPYLRKIYELIDWLQKHKPLSP